MGVFSFVLLRLPTILARTVPVFTALMAIATAASFLYYWEPTRVAWKVWSANSPYLYESIKPKFLKTDPARLIRIGTASDATRIRGALMEAIWGRPGPPRGMQPQKIEKDIPLTPAYGMDLDELAGLDNLSGVNRLWIPIDEFYLAAIYHLRPAKRNGKLILYHNGFGKRANFLDQGDLIAAMIGQGYDVLAFNIMGQGGSRGRDIYLPRHGMYRVRGWRILDLVDRPLRFYVDPVVIGLNALLKADTYSRVDMIGFSVGAWVTVLASAVDSRIQGSYTIAGPYPIYLRSGEERQQSPRPQYYRPMLQAANYLEMFILAARGQGRRQLQIFNRYDACCYNNTKAKLYEPAVQKAVALCCAGRFDVVVDESHTRHAISPFALRVIWRDMARRDGKR